jgi:hypothetical protein
MNVDDRRSGLSMRLVKQWDMDPHSTIAVMCSCGAIFEYSGLYATALRKAWSEAHKAECPDQRDPEDA